MTVGYLSRIEIHPGHQGHGIGTRIISALLAEAERTGQDLVLDVFTVNRRACALYRRLGLTEVARHGDRGTKVTMRSARRAARSLLSAFTQRSLNALRSALSASGSVLHAVTYDSTTRQGGQR